MPVEYDAMTGTRVLIETFRVGPRDFMLRMSVSEHLLREPGGPQHIAADMRREVQNAAAEVTGARHPNAAILRLADEALINNRTYQLLMAAGLGRTLQDVFVQNRMVVRNVVRQDNNTVYATDAATARATGLFWPDPAVETLKPGLRPKPPACACGDRSDPAWAHDPDECTFIGHDSWKDDEDDEEDEEDDG